MSRTRKALIVLALALGVAGPTGVANAGTTWSAERPMTYAGTTWN